jgi:hypothetical protein
MAIGETGEGGSRTLGRPALPNPKGIANQSEGLPRSHAATLELDAGQFLPQSGSVSRAPTRFVHSRFPEGL